MGRCSGCSAAPGEGEMTCQTDESIPIVIVGAGPTGLAAGNLLGVAGIPTLIIERNAGLSNIPKAIALDDEGLRICQAMGLSTAISNCIVSDISVHCVSEGRLLAKVVPTSKRNGYPLISTFYQPEFEAVLLDGLRRFSCVNVRFQHTVETIEQSADGVIVSIRTSTGPLKKVRCSYLLACDGGGSTIRHSLNIPLQGKTFGQKWLVIDSISDGNSPAVVKIFCNPQRPAVSIPAPHDGRRWEFMLLPGETEKEVFASATQGRAFLLGDAAHMMPPFGGQGLNSGLRDAHNLAWKVAMVLQHRATPQLLATYHQERSRHAAQMVAFASFLGTIFMSTVRLLAFCRNLLIQMLYALPITRQYLMEMRMKPQTKYTAGFFLFKGQKKSMVGSLLPQPEVITQQGQRVLLDEVLGPGFALLRGHANAAEAFASLNTDFWGQLGARFVCIQTDDVQSCRKWTEYAKKDGESLPIVVVRSMDKDFLREVQDHFILVRPDRFILAIFKEEEADAFVSGFQRLLDCDR